MHNTAKKLFPSDKIRNLLDKYAQEYDKEDFIKDDPVQFIHLYEKQQDIEIAGFIASIFAYGKRELFIKRLKTFLKKERKLSEFIKYFDENDEVLKNFNYRFSKGVDFIQILKILQKLEKEKESLESLFRFYYEKTHDIVGMFSGVTDYFYSNVTMDITQGYYHLLPDARKGGAIKRMNMMLRWFVRKSPVDVGIWTFIDKSELIIPLDVHVGNISRQIGLLTRKNNDMKSAMEITKNLRKFDEKDPIKYDFALFGLGVNGFSLQKSEEIINI